MVVVSEAGGGEWWCGTGDEHTRWRGGGGGAGGGAGGGVACVRQGTVSEQQVGALPRWSHPGGERWAEVLQGIIKLIKNNVFYQFDLY